MNPLFRIIFIGVFGWGSMNDQLLYIFREKGLRRPADRLTADRNMNTAFLNLLIYT